MCHKPVAVPDTEVFLLGQPDQTGRGNTEGIIALAEDLVLIRLGVPSEPHYRLRYRG